ncbi:hypothetical protein M595_3133 [Lyngbya aestuarii BL J]|uniref:Uncharacterized protein n=1 Tax=Lyngbya aestuarii BL J TaxID=1348334 RepID=U7QKA9_9CYAN|nr:hypothetical protein M595_3133 [Lyngbya aestuarii BL J]
MNCWKVECIRKPLPQIEKGLSQLLSAFLKENNNNSKIVTAESNA